MPGVVESTLRVVQLNVGFAAGAGVGGTAPRGGGVAARAAARRRLLPGGVGGRQHGEHGRLDRRPAPGAGLRARLRRRPVRSVAVARPVVALRVGGAVPLADRCVDVPPAPDRRGDPGDGIAAKVPWELLHVRTAGLDVFSCHLAAPPTDGLHRRRQVLAIDEIIRECRGDLDRSARSGTVARRCRPCCAATSTPSRTATRSGSCASLTALDGRTTYYQDAWRVAGEGLGATQDGRRTS